jgi:SAM-dependent methyltransferase
VFRQHLIFNVWEVDLFFFFNDTATTEIYTSVKSMLTRLDDYNPGTMSEDPAEARDLLKGLYQELFPRSVRHHLGEYYTPDWLAEHTLDQVGYEGDPDRRVLDPSCGSGTFLVLEIARTPRWCEKNRERCSFTPGEVLKRILANVVGFDLNPLAVMAARTNYLIAIRDLIPHVSEIEIPVYLCDSVATPAVHGGDLYNRPVRKLATVAAVFEVPAEMTTDQVLLGRYTDLLQTSVERKDDVEEFIERCGREGLSLASTKAHATLYEELLRLDRENRNGIWARIIKNSFAPLFSGRFDYVIGNPPWVNWENLPEDYRDALKPLWIRYGLFSLGGMAGRLGGGKKDLSMLFAYACTDNYLVDGGKLGFVITQTVFKSTGAGDGFRRLAYKVDSGTGRESFVHLNVLSVDDFSDFQPFEDATNRTAVFVWEKGSQTAYPVPYSLWFKQRGKRVGVESKLHAVRKATSRTEIAARPIQKDKSTSPWLVGTKQAVRALAKVIGPSAYRAYEGCNTGGLNGAYWIRILEHLRDGNLLIENLHEVGKKRVKSIRTAIEPDFVYPLLRGRDVGSFRAEPSAHILMVQDPEHRIGWEEKAFKKRCPLAHAYLKKFEESLRKRKSSSIQGLMARGPFYSMFAVDEHTLSAWKACWSEVGHDLALGIVGPWNDATLGERVIIPDHTVVFVPAGTAEEAHYLAAILNCSASQAIVRGYVSLHPSPHVLQNIAVPKYGSAQADHRRLSDLSSRAHSCVSGGRTDELRELLREIDEAAAALWGLSANELGAIKKSLEQLTPSRTGDASAPDSVHEIPEEVE